MTGSFKLVYVYAWVPDEQPSVPQPPGRPGNRPPRPGRPPHPGGGGGGQQPPVPTDPDAFPTHPIYIPPGAQAPPWYGGPGYPPIEQAPPTGGGGPQPQPQPEPPLEIWGGPYEPPQIWGGPYFPPGYQPPETGGAEPPIDGGSDPGPVIPAPPPPLPTLDLDDFQRRIGHPEVPDLNTGEWTLVQDPNDSTAQPVMGFVLWPLVVTHPDYNPNYVEQGLPGEWVIAATPTSFRWCWIPTPTPVDSGDTATQLPVIPPTDTGDAVPGDDLDNPTETPPAEESEPGTPTQLPADGPPSRSIYG